MNQLKCSVVIFGVFALLACSAKKETVNTQTSSNHPTVANQSDAVSDVACDGTCQSYFDTSNKTEAKVHSNNISTTTVVQNNDASDQKDTDPKNNAPKDTEAETIQNTGPSEKKLQDKQISNKVSTANKIKQGLALGVKETAKWIDSFFADPEYPNEKVDVQFDLRQEFTKLESDPWDLKTRFSGRVKLPNAERAISLTFDGNDREEDSQGSSNLNDSVQKSNDQPSLGIEYLEQVRPGFSKRFKVGYRFGRSSAYVGGRIRQSMLLGKGWQFRLSERVRWYHQFGWENRAIFDFDRLLPKDALFQQRLLMLWQQDEKDTRGIQLNLRSALIYPISDHSAWRVIWSSDYDTQPNQRWTASQLGVGYRMKLWQDWVFVELRPFTRWEEEHNWQPKYGINLTFDFIIER
ncbi:hypothetical protein C8D97_10979 [Pleionea mediterranea]|uniref:Uncharacterized protein n=1 Tax=Pleionea mediterranea TaxID=523701 RepID=A0A316FHY4_9GAMM|nr:hypothetical protein C8D97_10979 [Pleionea mediterranea]